MAAPESASGQPADLFSFKREMLAVLPSLRAFAVSLSRRHDRADDLVQETVMKAWGKQESFQPGTSMRAWLFTILRNEFYSQMRRKGRELPDPDGVFAGNLATHPEQYGKLDMGDFKTALDSLPDDQREAIVLIGASGFSYEEAAEIAGVAVGTIKSRVNRARVKLQDLLGVDGENDYGPDETSRPLVNKAFPGR
ncbi:sigma-70 family RNA polymerase sigma factor [Hoeflea sp. YIM 152468]|uniref:sigma-70 family RNA polymerase sigma factor n=1 Tax=Hoeflea sp. YIM 152468 TaxID=3031759 RepID=UPI0023DBBD45|nr:sigma-70 family RNA polymerase sigma factor [Hoeflea sp. YIM 152468]MDF1609937.1 sigma-70 family RNA polymerase sigma factor [Hoeflea sp. YIM 152468]